MISYGHSIVSMSKRIKEILTILIFSLLPIFLIWLPFFLRIPNLWGIPIPGNGMATVVSNYDGPLYLVVAKSFYDKVFISQTFQFPLPAEYYAAHFPLYPSLVKIFSFATNFPYAMLGATLLSSAFAIYYFYLLAREILGDDKALFLAFVFSVFPARWLIVRSVGSADPLFVGLIIASLYYFKKKQYWGAAIAGSLAQLTKSPGALLFVSYFIFLLLPELKMRLLTLKKGFFARFDIKKTYPLLLIPVSLLAVFSIYHYRMGDFLAYFHSGDNIHLGFLPFQIFNYSAPWVGTSWLEEIIMIYLVGGVGIAKLIHKREFEIASFAGVYYFFILFVSHRDILRYFLPVVPLLIIAFGDELGKKYFKPVLILILLPIYLFSIAFISQNAMPISNWAPFL